MKIYIDCTSGSYHLVKLSNDRFDLLKNDVMASELDEKTKVIKTFIRCYHKNRIGSKCGRAVIESHDLLSNLNEAIQTLHTTLDDYELTPILEAAFKGIWDNCAQGHDQDYYLPASVK